MGSFTGNLVCTLTLNVSTCVGGQACGFFSQEIVQSHAHVGWNQELWLLFILLCAYSLLSTAFLPQPFLFISLLPLPLSPPPFFPSPLPSLLIFSSFLSLPFPHSSPVLFPSPPSRSFPSPPPSFLLFSSLSSPPFTILLPPLFPFSSSFFSLCPSPSLTPTTNQNVGYQTSLNRQRGRPVAWGFWLANTYVEILLPPLYKHTTVELYYTTKLMKGTEVPNPRCRSACDCTCVLTRKSITVSWLSQACHAHCFVPAHAIWCKVQVSDALSQAISHYLILLLPYVS